MKIFLNSEIDFQVWDELAKDSIFHSRKWIAVLCNSYGLKPFYAMAVNGNNFALIAACKIRGEYISLPYTFISGFLHNSMEMQKALEFELANSGCKVHYRLLGEVSPSTQVIASVISFSDISSYWKSLSKNMRNQIRKSEMTNFDFIKNSDIDDFYKVFSKNMHRLGTPTHGRDFFHALKASYDTLRVFTVHYCGKPVASLCGVIGNDVIDRQVTTFYNLWASTLHEYDKLYVNYFLYWHMIQSIAAEGICRINLGSSIVDSGVFKFKQKFRVENYAIYDHTIGANFSVNNTYKTSPLLNIAANIWCTMPYSFSLWLGPKLRKYLP